MGQLTHLPGKKRKKKMGMKPDLFPHTESQYGKIFEESTGKEHKRRDATAERKKAKGDRAMLKKTRAEFTEKQP